MSETLFISDLHLAAERPDIIQLYTKFLDDKAATAKQLFILGDFVEYWLGDDDEAPELEFVFNKMKQLSDDGLNIYLMHGNRDFLMGEDFAQRSGCQLIADPHIIYIDDKPILLMHGDTLCTDDVDYQKLRVMLRNPQWQLDFLSRPLEERRMMAKQLRETSKQETQNKSDDIMDVNNDAVKQAFVDHSITLMIHGHTHRPNVHHLTADEKALTRVVLGDWYMKGSYLAMNGFNDFSLNEYT